MAVIGSDSLSSILGWVSIASWVVVYSPQIVENYQLKSGEALSVAFVVIWLLGDLCNLVGAGLAGLLPTVIILAVYYTLCDLVLLFQIYFYRWGNRIRTPRPPDVSSADQPGERSPLLNHNLVQEKTVSSGRLFLQYAAAVLFVCATGVVAWWISKGVQKDETEPKHRAKDLDWIIQLIGWTSASLYLGARIPQIFKNFKTRCEGLSPALFLFAIFGNTTYALSICVASMERNYLIMNASWLAGSALTVFLDVFVLGQFLYYRSIDRTSQDHRNFQ